MGAKTIITRYVERRALSTRLAKEQPEELRRYFSGIAQRDGLKVTETELDDLVAKFGSAAETGEQSPVSNAKPNKPRKRVKKLQTGKHTTPDDLKRIEKS